MADIKELSMRIDRCLQEKKDTYDNIRYGRSSFKEKLQKKTIHVEEDKPKSQLKIRSKEEMYSELKDKFRYAWKSPGYCNSAFSNPPVLQGKLLRPWDRERCIMPDRSCKAPKDFKGMNVTYKSSEFGDAPEILFPKQYREFLKTAKHDYMDRVMRPSNYGPLEDDIKLANIPYKIKERGWKRSTTAQIREFGFDRRAAYNTEQSLKSKTSHGTRIR